MMDVARLTEIGGGLARIHGATAAARAEHPAVRLPDENGRFVTLSHGELDHRSAAVAGWFQAQGITKGDRVLLCAPNSTGFVLAYLALHRIGAVVVLANPAYTDAELRHLYTDSEARAAILPDDRALDTPLRVSAEQPLPAGDPVPATPAVPDDPAVLAYTSGTTGVPKGVVLTQANLYSSIRAVMAAWQWSPRDVLVHALPLSHQHGLGGLHATLLAGSTAVLLPRFDPAEFTAHVLESRATVLFGVPAIYRRLLAEPDQLAALARVRPRLVVSGSAPLDAADCAALGEVFGQIPLERYGTTESGLNVANPYAGGRQPGTVGLPLPGVRLRLLEDAEIAVAGPQVFRRYWNRPEASAEAFTEDGFFRTGDLGEFDPESGHLRISGRKKELIISGGLNVYPREVELAIEAHPDVAEAGVAGVASARWGEEVTAWVVPRQGTRPGEAELLAHAAARLAKYKCPKHIHLVPDLPRNSMGKLMRRALGTRNQ
ncbi:class I adenylate-forming enzyme family protein [Sciscionella sediminilitoris]|uniref:class I adenylate-forming enzyme family protein n=1 Tax=Sciscionella sediminilitoris TaxID=1445613 RepID=UPI00055B4246|nr:AMP-binding protein [Sciscionella sp. SE31]